MDTSSSPRQEWYAEESREPDEPRTTPVPFEQTNGILKVGDVVRDKSGIPMGVVASIDYSNQSVSVMVAGQVSHPRRAGKTAYMEKLAEWARSQ